MIPNRWLMLLVLFMARTEMAYQFQTVGSVGTSIIAELVIDFTTLGTLIGLYLLPGVFVALLGGMFGQRFGAKQIVLFGLALMFFGGALTGSASIAVVVGGRLISGIGAVLINVMMTKMVADWFAGREIVTAMAIFIASWPLGLAIGLVTFPPLATTYSWHAVMYLGSFVAAACFLLVALIYADPPAISVIAPRSPQKFGIDLTGSEWKLVSLAGLIWGIYNVAYIVLISFLPELFVTRGYSQAEAGQIVSFLGWTLIPSVPLAGYLAERLGRSDLLMVGGFTVVAISSLALPFMNAPLGVFSVIAVAIGIPAGLIMALPAQVLRSDHRAAGMGVFYAWYYGTMALLPPLAGKIRDFSGSTSTGALFSTGMIVLAMLGLVAFRVAQRMQPIVSRG